MSTTDEVVDATAVLECGCDCRPPVPAGSLSVWHRAFRSPTWPDASRASHPGLTPRRRFHSGRRSRHISTGGPVARVWRSCDEVSGERLLYRLTPNHRSTYRYVDRHMERDSVL